MTTSQTTRIAALNNARQIFANDNSLSWSECMKLGWRKAKAEKALSAAPVVVTFTTTSGVNVSRLASSLSLAGFATKGSTKKTNPLQVCFFDHDAQGVRSFNVTRLVKVG